MRTFAVACAVAWVAGAGIRAQPGSADTLQPGELTLMRLPLQRLQPTSDMLTRWAAAPHWSFDGFDQTHLGFRSVTLTLDRLAIDCPFAHGEHAVAHVIVKRDSATRVDYWQLLEPFETDANNPCAQEDADRWSVVDIGASADPSGMPATPDVDLPIFRIAYSARWIQHRSTDEYHQQLVIDARTTPPTLAARLASGYVETFCSGPAPSRSATCRWNANRGDFFCVEEYSGGSRYVWMLSGERPLAPPDTTAPRDLAAFISTLSATSSAIGRWAAPQDVGAVRLIAQLPHTRAGQQVLLFGASEDLGHPFVIAVSDARGMRVVRVPLVGNERAESPVSASAPLTEQFRSTREPPTFTVRPRPHLGLVRLFHVVSELNGYRTLYDVGVDDSGNEVVAGAVHVTSTPTSREEAFAPFRTSDFGACDEEGGFAVRKSIRFAPLRIEYDVEPNFHVREDGLTRDEDTTCVLSSRATWLANRGFMFEQRTGPCSTTRFRVGWVRPDGTVDIRTRTTSPGRP